MMRCDSESNDQRLVYRVRSMWFIGLPLAILGLGLLAGNRGELIRRWTDWDKLSFGYSARPTTMQPAGWLSRSHNSSERPSCPCPQDYPSNEGRQVPGMRLGLGVG